MNVLQLCPVWHPVSRDAPGGIETLLAHLSVHLARRGCALTHLASGESQLEGRLVSVMPQSVCTLMHEGRASLHEYFEQHQLQLAMGFLAEAAVVHSHIGPSGFVLSALPGMAHKTLHTLHGPVSEELLWFAERNPHVRFSVVSQFQRDRLRTRASNFCAVVPNGVQVDSFEFSERGAGRLFFMGRIERDKGPDAAIATAKSLGLPLDLAGPIVQKEFFHKKIEPLLDDQVRYLGILNHEQKVRRLREADCVLMPSRWDEPFGLVAVEAMACGTPVVANRRGALPEIVEDGVTGFIVDDEQQIAAAVRKAMALPRRAVRERCIGRFDLAAVAAKYHDLYGKIAREQE